VLLKGVVLLGVVPKQVDPAKLAKVAKVAKARTAIKARRFIMANLLL
jgi:hypothetical protein